MTPEKLLEDPEFKDLAIENLRLENELMALKVASETRMGEKIKAAPADTGQFQFVGTVREVTVHGFMTEADNFSRRNPGAPIEIMLNSAGGSVLDGLALVDFLKALSKRGHHVRIIGYGLVASMAGVILQAADERVITPHCWLGIHEVSSVVQGSVTVQDDQISFTKGLQGHVVELLTEKSNMTKRQLEARWKRRDLYMNAAEALKHGFVDRIEDL